MFLSLDKCLFLESWDDGRGHSGQNMFAYSEDDKNWYGMFADNEGRVHVFTSGKVSAGVARFRGYSGAANEAKVLNRMKIVRLAADKAEPGKNQAMKAAPGKPSSAGNTRARTRETCALRKKL